MASTIEQTNSNGVPEGSQVNGHQGILIFHNFSIISVLLLNFDCD